MALSPNDVADLARLARIELTDDELHLLAPQLEVILESVASISGRSRSCRTVRRPSRSSRTTCPCSSDSASDWSVEPPAARCDSLAASRSAR